MSALPCRNKESIYNRQVGLKLALACCNHHDVLLQSDSIVKDTTCRPYMRTVHGDRYAGLISL